MIDRGRFLAWVRGGQDDALAKLLFTGSVLLSIDGKPCSIASMRDNGSRVENVLR